MRIALIVGQYYYSYQIIFRTVSQKLVRVKHNLLINSCINHVLAAASQLPPIQTIRRTIRRTKQQATVPQNVYNLVILERYQWTSNNEQFLLYDNLGAENASRMVSLLHI